MFKSILLVGLALAAALVVEAKPDIVFATEKNMKGDTYRCEELDYQVCYNSDSYPYHLVKSLKFTNYDFPDHKDFSVTIYSGGSCNGHYDRWSFTQKDDGKDTMNSWRSLNHPSSFKIANFLTSDVTDGNIGKGMEPTRNPNCWQE
ncbi:hypothetical protein BGZ95_003087 [Linnemannia exigua]|uniref:Uncharacterized protein n=1 Tax=Linnemannia exigua TaxID=604196 RepID=A0AAD4DID8_9FUNG|nr:hypothetical protein BGZ95_003087 [Linnemannia exigua]